MRYMAWNKYVLFYLKLYFIHISNDKLFLWAQNAIKQFKWTYLENCYVKVYKIVKLANLPSCQAAQLPLILYMVSENTAFGVGGNVKFFFYRSEFYTHDHKNLYSELENCLLIICKVQFSALANILCKPELMEHTWYCLWRWYIVAVNSWWSRLKSNHSDAIGLHKSYESLFTKGFGVLLNVFAAIYRFLEVTNNNHRWRRAQPPFCLTEFSRTSIGIRT